MSKNLNKIFTSESVSEGHPDKVCDQISDAILDACLAQDPNSRVACECFAGKGFLVISGEITTKAVVNYDEIARNTIRRIGYVDPELGFSADTVAIMVMINKQSPDIALRTGDDIGGAGDQGIMFGYACNETKELMPATLAFSNNIVKRLAELRKVEGSYASKVLRPDAKSQVSIEYDEEGKVKRIDTIVVSTQHSPDYSQEEIYDFVKNVVINDCIPKRLIDENTKFFINPSGRFVIGGPMGDTGLTGRKIIVDTYGGRAAHGGGCFCVDGDTEFLTPKGWKKIKDYEPMDKVGQWNCGFLEFVNPYAYINTESKDMYHLESQSLDMVLSGNHDVVLETSKGNIIKKQLKTFIEKCDDGSYVTKNGSTGSVPCKFVFNPETRIDLTDDQIRLQVAFCADGTIINGAYNRIRVVKDYKIDRLISLLEKTGTIYRVSDDSEGEAKIFWFDPPIISKSLVECFSKASFKQMVVIANELVRWDGDRECIFRTTIKEDADFAQFIMMASSYKNASIRVDDRIGETYGKDDKYIRKSICYEVRRKISGETSIRTGSRSATQVKIKQFKSEDGRMYCFTVPSGMLLLRRNNKVFVTGNSGKDSTKVDRSAAYMARYLAKNVVAAGLAEQCEIELAYAIGKVEPVSVYVDTYGTGRVADNDIAEFIKNNFDLSPSGMIKFLDLRKPQFEQLAAYGHMGREELGVKWEDTSECDKFKTLLK